MTVTFVFPGAQLQFCAFKHFHRVSFSCVPSKPRGFVFFFSFLGRWFLPFCGISQFPLLQEGKKKNWGWRCWAESCWVLWSYFHEFWREFSVSKCFCVFLPGDVKSSRPIKAGNDPTPYRKDPTRSFLITNTTTELISSLVKEKKAQPKPWNESWASCRQGFVINSLLSRFSTSSISRRIFPSGYQREPLPVSGWFFSSTARSWHGFASFCTPVTAPPEPVARKYFI